MRNHVVHARAGGVNLAFLGGNEIYRHIRLDPTPLGAGRLETDHKSFTEDPASKTNHLAATQEWRSPPTPGRKARFLGNFYQCNRRRSALRVVWLRDRPPDGYRRSGPVPAAA